MDNIKSILLANGYPDHIIRSTTAKKIRQFNAPARQLAAKCPVYLHIPWLGTVSKRFEKQVSASVRRCFFAVEPRVVFTTRSLLPSTKKDVLPASQKSNVIYQFLCHCDSRYVGRTSQRLEERIKQHVPKHIRNQQPSQDRTNLSRSCKSKNLDITHVVYDSAIGQHLADNPTCAANYTNDRFVVIARARTSFHLSALEATFISCLRPNLCRQKEFVYSLKLAH